MSWVARRHRNERQRLVGRAQPGRSTKLGTNDRMDPLGIARCSRMQVDEQQVMAPLK